MRMASGALHCVAITVVALTMGACDSPAVTDPVSPDDGSVVPRMAAALPSVPASTPYPASQQVDRAIVCKDASSPAGSYSFTVSASPLLPGDQVATGATLSPGQCAIVFNRTTTSSSFVNVTMTENIPQGASYQLDHVAVNDIDGPRDVSGPTVTLKVNRYHGAVANYFNEPVPPPSGLPTPTPYPATQQPDKAIVCKDASSPAGSYTFNISASGTLAGDQVATSATLSPGQCAIVYSRGTSSQSFTNVTSTEVIPQGASYELDRVAVNDIDGPRNLAGPTVTLKVNRFHGSVANYFNKPAQTVGPASGEVRVCKSANSPSGTFNFTTTVVGTIASDVVTSNVALTAGSCATVFLRTQVGPVAATVTVKETLDANGNVFLSGVTVNGAAATTVGAAVVVQQDNTAGKLVVFFNANATVGTQVAYHPNSPTPGQVIVCKSANSPAGTFNFTVTGAGTVGTDQIASNVSLSAGQCKSVFIRSTVEPVPASLLVTEVISAGANYTLATVQHIRVTGSTFVGGAGGVALAVNGGQPNTGHVLVFFNVAVAIP